MKKSTARSLKTVIMVLLVAIVVIGLFYRSQNMKSAGEEDDEVEVTAIDEALSRNLDTNYPATPKEVIKYFGEISQCFYNETFESDEQFEALADKMLLIYDDELVAYKTHEDYIADLQSDIADYTDNGYKLSNFTPSASTDVEYFSEDGYDWARIWCVFTVKSGTSFKNLNECFILRKDENDHWKIYGWKEEDE